MDQKKKQEVRKWETLSLDNIFKGFGVNECLYPSHQGRLTPFETGYCHAFAQYSAAETAVLENLFLVAR